jgi:hypothetical protein
MSTKTGRAPTALIASAVAIKVWATVITSWPGPTPTARSTNSSAAVPLATPTQCAGATLGRKIAFELLDCRPHDEVGGVQHRPDRLSTSGRMAAILGGKDRRGAPW